MAKANICFPKYFALEAKDGGKYFKKKQEDPFSKSTYCLRKPVILPRKGKRVSDILLAALRNRRLKGERISRIRFVEFVDLLNDLFDLDPVNVSVSSAMSHPCFRKKTAFRFNFIRDSTALKKTTSLKLFTSEKFEKKTKRENYSLNLSIARHLCLGSCRPDRQNLYVLRLFFNDSEEDFKDYFIEIPVSDSTINIAYDDEWKVSVNR